MAFCWLSQILENNKNNNLWLIQSDQFRQIIHTKSKINHYNIQIIKFLGVFKWTLNTIVYDIAQQARLSQSEVEEIKMHDSRQPVVYPNPNNRSFTIDLNFDPEEKVSISLIDLTGRIIYNSFQSIK